MTDISLFTAFLAGVISFISPCVLPLIPMYISFISGISMAEMISEDNRRQVMKKVAFSAFLFVLGFSIVFIGLGASATILGKFLLKHFQLFSKISGIMIILLGLYIAGVFKIGFLNYEKRFHLGRKPVGLIGPLLAGLAFAFAWTPCIGPILSGILVYSSSQNTVYRGILMLSMYSLGLGIPFMLSGLSINTFLQFSARIRKYYKAVQIFTGAFLVIMGILMITSSFSILAQYIARWFPWISI